MRRLRPHRLPEAIAAEPEVPLAESISQTRNLIMAALRVWELKHGIHDYY